MFDPLRYRKERWFDDDRAEQIAEAPINDDAAEGGPSEKQNGKKSKVKISCVGIIHAELSCLCYSLCFRMSVVPTRVKEERRELRTA